MRIELVPSVSLACPQFHCSFLDKAPTCEYRPDQALTLVTVPEWDIG